ncbi:hypothetical protein ACHQM5_015515 [Ranunculus cassubicifolius]
MIQELFGGAGASFLGGGGDSRKICFNGMLENSSPSPAVSTTSTKSNSNPTTPTTTAPPPPDSQNLRCPRCDSSNTKFCYYNNYNLTQPRHFCKTCRRYWTKGGALRNVPIGGGCRKNKTSSTAATTPATTAVKTTSGKIKTMSSEFGKSNFGFDLDPPSNPLLWASPQNSQLMALLRAAQNPNPNSVPSIKQEESMIGSYNMSGCGSDSSAINARPINGVDPLGQFPAPFWRNNQHQQTQSYQNQNQNQQHSSLSMADLQSTGIQELFQRLRSTGNYYSDHSSSQLSNNVMHHTSSPAIIEPTSITGADVGYWNTPTFAWSNLSTTNGAFP